MSSKNSAETQVDYNAYLLRMWRDKAAGGWRITLKDVRGPKQLHFPSLDGLMAYLQELNEAENHPSHGETA